MINNLNPSDSEKRSDRTASLRATGNCPGNFGIRDTRNDSDDKVPSPRDSVLKKSRKMSNSENYLGKFSPKDISDRDCGVSERICISKLQLNSQNPKEMQSHDDANSGICAVGTLHRELCGNRKCLQNAARAQHARIEGEKRSCVMDLSVPQEINIRETNTYSRPNSSATSAGGMIDIVDSLLDDLLSTSLKHAPRIQSRDMSAYDPVRRLRDPLRALPPKGFMRNRDTLIL